MTDSIESDERPGEQLPPFLDTNILVYAHDLGDDPEKRRIARRLIERAINEEAPLTISNQILIEFFHATTTRMKRRIPAPEAREAVADYAGSRGFVKIQYTTTTVVRAIDLHVAHRVGQWDGLIAATMLENGIRTIITEDDGGISNIPGIEVENPFTR